MWRLAKILTAGLLWLAGLQVVHAQTTELRFGVFPNLSSRFLIETYQPLSQFLSTSLQQHVALQTAPDFRIFFERTQAGAYDLVLTASHLAWLAVGEANYRPLFAYKRNTEGILVVRADSGFKSLASLRGKTIALADPLAITVMRMENELAQSGLAAGRDYTRLHAGSHNNAALQVHAGKSDAAILGGLPFQRLPENIRKDLRIIKTTASFPGQVYLIHPRVGNVREQAIHAALQEFMQTPQGQAFLEQGGFEGLRVIKRSELSQFALDGQQIKQQLFATSQPAK